MSLRAPIRFDHSAVFPAGRSFFVLATHHCYAMGLIETAGCVANYGARSPISPFDPGSELCFVSALSGVVTRVDRSNKHSLVLGFICQDTVKIILVRAFSAAALQWTHLGW